MPDPDPTDRYDALVSRLTAGEQIPRDELLRVLVAAQRDYRDLAGGQVLSRKLGAGQPCPCGGRIRVRTSRVVGGYRTQYLDCPSCGQSHGQRSQKL